LYRQKKKGRDTGEARQSRNFGSTKASTIFDDLTQGPVKKGQNQEREENVMAR